MNYMYHFRHSNGGISFIGINHDSKVYSKNYYANVGILNSEESKFVALHVVEEKLRWCIEHHYEEVTYLPKED